MFYLIAYDITDNKCRNRVSHILEGYGVRVQFSVFECILKSPIFEELMGKLSEVLNKHEDSLRIYRICRSCKENIEIKGIGSVYEPKDIVFV